MTLETAAPDISSEPFGRLSSGAQVTRYTLRSPVLTCSLLDFGATVQRFEHHFGPGPKRESLILNSESLATYESDAYYMGCMVGRTAGRIGDASYVLGDTRAELTANQGRHHLHGGIQGFNKRLWQRTETPPEHAQKQGGPLPGPSLTLTLLSPDGDQGHPGTLQIWVTYELQGNCLHIRTLARTPTQAHVNLTNHMYLHLGERSDRDPKGNTKNTTIDRHTLCVNARGVLATTPDLVPTGDILDLSSPLDWTTPRTIGSTAIDHTFVLGSQNPAVILTSPDAQRTLTVSTDLPVAQIYTGDYLGSSWCPRAGICIETQRFPNAPNCPQFPTTLVTSEQPFSSLTTFKVQA